MFKIMNSLIKEQIFSIILSIVLGTFTILVNVGLLSTSSLLISRAALHPEVLDLMVLIVAVRFFGISRGFFRYCERLISHNTTLKMLSSLRRWVYKRFNENYSENNSKFKTGDIYTKIVNDVDVIKDFYLRAFFPTLIALVSGICTALFISYFCIGLAIIYFIFYIFCGFIIPAIFFRVNKKFSVRESELKNSLNVSLLDTFKGICEIQIYDLKAEAIEKFTNINKELLKIKKARNLMNSLKDNIVPIITSILIVIALIETGELIAVNKFNVIYYSMLPLTILASLEGLTPISQAIYKFYDTYNSMKNIFSIAGSEEIKPSNNVNKVEINNFDIDIDNISIKDGNEYLIKNLTLKLPYKKKVAVVGTNGSGKSTLLRSLLGFIKYDSGSIRISGESYGNIEIDEIRKYFTYIDQKPYTFNTSLLENLLIANSEASEEEIFKVLKEVQIKELIEKLHDKLNTIIGQYGYNLSGGEIERLTIARALLKHSKIILLDEPTSSLDIKLEKKVTEGIQALIQDKSCIWVTHRLINMEWMDEILVMDKGVVVERGTHETLLATKGLYYKLWKIQKQYLYS